MRRTPKNRSDREVAKSIALQLPDVELCSHHGTMDIRVHNKVFATFPAQSKAVVLKCTAENLGALIEQNPEGFSKGRGDTSVHVDLEHIDRATLQALLIESWVLSAPAKLRELYKGQLAKRIR